MDIDDLTFQLRGTTISDYDPMDELVNLMGDASINVESPEHIAAYNEMEQLMDEIDNHEIVKFNVNAVQHYFPRWLREKLAIPSYPHVYLYISKDLFRDSYSFTWADDEIINKYHYDVNNTADIVANLIFYRTPYQILIENI